MMRTDEIRELAVPLDPQAIDTLVDAVGDARYVLLGEASHGTSEYYRWRTEISKRLIVERGFSFVAVEGDWPDCFRINRWAKGRVDPERDARDVLQDFDRWPTWMWANEEVARFTGWLREHNATSSNRAGFYGLDVYSLWDSLRVVFGYLSEHHPEHLETAGRAMRCFQPYDEDPQSYAWSTRFLPEGCQDEVIRLLGEVRGHAGTLNGDPEAELDAVQNAEVVAGAERYYRIMIRADGESWNVRDIHMMDTLDRLVDFHGSQTKAIVWAHNTHVGDARATPMAAGGMLNIGQLTRDRHAANGVVLVGFGGHRGSVVAADAWGEQAQRFPVPVAPPGSHEDLIHEALGRPSLFTFPDDRSTPWLAEPRGHRAIGVVYDPRGDRRNWVPTIMGARYDAFLYFEDTQALHPLDGEPAEPRERETYPWAV